MTVGVDNTQFKHYKVLCVVYTIYIYTHYVYAGFFPVELVSLISENVNKNISCIIFINYPSLIFVISADFQRFSNISENFKFSLLMSEFAYLSDIVTLVLNKNINIRKRALNPIISLSLWFSIKYINIRKRALNPIISD